MPTLHTNLVWLMVIVKKSLILQNCTLALTDASITFYAFNSNGNKGIACGLNNLQKLRDGEPLGGRTRAEDVDFATEDDDDFLN